jgi:hypothetical protein
MAILSLYKYSIIKSGGIPDIITDQLKGSFETLGLAVKTTTEGKNIFDVANSFKFEGIASLLTIMLIIYYSGQINHALTGLPFKYVHHSRFLKMYPLIYTLFYITIGLDTFFSQTLLQLLVLGRPYFF